MAVETEKTVVLNIDAQPGIKSMKELKQAIKDGKDQLAGLTQGTEEYDRVLSQTAELQHQYREIQEQVNRSTSDFGQTLSNVNSVLSGGVAAIQGVTAGLSLIGVNMGDDDKLTKKLIQSMSLLQAMSKMDVAIKGFKALTVSIKAATVASGGLGKALKALAVSNPFTAILAGVTAVIAAFSLLKSKEEEVKSAEEVHDDAVKALTLSYYSLADAMNGLDNARLFNNDTEIQGKIDALNGKYMNFAKQSTNAGRVSQKVWEDFYNQIMTTGTAEEKKLIGLANAQYNYNEAIYEMNRIRNYHPSEGMWIESEAQKQEMIKEQQTIINGLYDKRNNLYKTYIDNQKKSNSNRDKELEQYKHLLSLAKQANQLLLAEEEKRYQSELALYENNAVKKEEIELAHQKRVLDINNEYIQKQIELMTGRLESLQKKNKDGSKQGDIDSLNEQINQLNRQMQDNTAAYEANSRAVEKARIQRELELQQLQKRLEMNRKVHDQQMETTLVMQQFDEDEIEGIKEKLSWLDYLGISYSDKYEMMMEKQRELIELEQEEKEAKVNVEAIQQEIDLWHEKYDAIEELTAEHYEELQRLQQEYEDASAALGEVRLKRIKKELDDERRERLAYANAVGQIMGTIGSLLTSIADAEGVSFEESKKIKIAAATVDTIQGGINAYMSYIASAIPPPTDSILGGIAAAATVAMGMIEIAKIRATKPGNSPSVSGSAMQGITLANPQIVNLNAVNDEIELPDTRVYVLESDITEAQNRVHVVENNSNF